MLDNVLQALSLLEPCETPLHRTAARRRQQWEALCSRLATPPLQEVDVTVVVFDDRDAERTPFLRLGCQLNERACRRRGFRFHFAGGPSWPELEHRPPHWARVALLQDLADQLPQGPSNFIVSLDSDAAFTNPDFPIEQLLMALPLDRSVFLAKDPPMWPPPRGWEMNGVFCSGFVLIRLDEPGRGFLARWHRSFDPGRWWQSEEGRWTAEGKWAGEAYEQGQLNLLAQGDMEHAVFELPQVLFNSSWVRPAGRPQPIVAHLMRRPGEWGWCEKERRVEAAFAGLLDCAAEAGAPAGGEGGVPRSAEALGLWEEEEEARALLSAFETRLNCCFAGEQSADDAQQHPGDGDESICSWAKEQSDLPVVDGSLPPPLSPGHFAGDPYSCGAGSAGQHGTLASASGTMSCSERSCAPQANVRFDVSLGCVEVVD